MKGQFDHIQKRITDQLRDYGNLPLSSLCEDSCSEISRLVSYWLYNENPSNEYSIIKGVNVRGEIAHDVLVIKDVDKYTLIDPSIWQFFPDEKSIYLGGFNSVKEILLFLENKYTGMWSVSEKMNKKSFDNKDKWINIIKSNIQENSRK